MQIGKKRSRCPDWEKDRPYVGHGKLGEKKNNKPSRWRLSIFVLSKPRGSRGPETGGRRGAQPGFVQSKRQEKKSEGSTG